MPKALPGKDKPLRSWTRHGLIARNVQPAAAQVPDVRPTRRQGTTARPGTAAEPRFTRRRRPGTGTRTPCQNAGPAATAGPAARTNRQISALIKIR